MNRCVVVAHGDCDGVCSAALAVAYLVEKCEVSVHFSHPVGLLQDLREFSERGDFIIVVDIAVNELHAGELVRYIEELAKTRLVLYIDHHPLPEDFKVPAGSTWIHDPGCSASELTYKYFHKLGLSDEYSRVALYGAICDYLDETPWVKNELLKWDRRSVFLEAGIVSQGLEGSRRDHEFERAVVEHLARNRLLSQMSELVARSIKQAELDEKLRLWVKENLKVEGQVAYVLNPPGSVGRAANYARIYGGVRVGVAIEERRELYIMSLRSVNFDLNKALRRISKKLGIHGGGHPLAAGARVPKQLFETFIEELNREIASSQQ